MGLGTKNETREVGRYALHGIIASGGMATVHFGRMVGAVGFSRTVAIKRLHAHFASDPEFVSMFLDEARLAARIRHPNVIPTLDVVATSGELFLVMEYVPGETLARLSKQVRESGRQIPHRIVGCIVSGVLHGLHAAHEAKDERGQPLCIVHRDVSPQNVHVGTDGVARVLDFGVAKAAGRIQTTREGQIKGKLAYMAPEQLRGAAIDRSCDIYAVGVMLWELVTGQRLFFGDNEGVVVARVLEGKIPAPSTVVQQGARTALSERTLTQLQRLDACILRAVNADPAKRFATARDMALELEACVQPSTSSQVGDWVENNATEILAERAAKVAEIESQQSSDPMDRPSDVQKLLRGEANEPAANKTLQLGSALPGMVHTDASRTAQLMQPSSPVTQPSTISVSSNLQEMQIPSFQEKPNRNRGVIFGSIAAVLLATLVAFFVLSNLNKKEPEVGRLPPIVDQGPSLQPTPLVVPPPPIPTPTESASEQPLPTPSVTATVRPPHRVIGPVPTIKATAKTTAVVIPPPVSTAPCPIVKYMENGEVKYKRECSK
jgi:eukaryotic-like serine/threonine-protein kinase